MKKEETEKTIEEPVKIPQKKNKDGGNVVAAFLLIFIGLLFLANNLGFVPWTVWSDLWRFWPVILILLGVQFLLGRSTLAQVLMAIITVSLLVLVSLIILASAGVLKGTGLENWGVLSSQRTNESVNQNLRVVASEFQNIRERKINIENSVGKFTLQDDGQNDFFALTTAASGNDSKPVLKTNQSGDVLTIDVKVPGDDGMPKIMRGGEKFEYSGNIGQPQIPTDVGVNIGAGEFNVILDAITLRTFSINVGAGSANIDLKDNAVPNESDLDIGVGSITYSVPKDVGLEVSYDVGLGNLRIENQDLRGNGTYKTKNYDQAVRKHRISAHVGTGSIKIER